MSTARASMPASSADSSVCPTAATCGSVKTTRGESGPPALLVEPRVAAEDHVGGDPGVVLAHVREQRAAVGVADRVEPVVPGHAQALVDLDRPAGLEPTASRPSSRVAARRPTPTSSSSPTSSSPDSSSTVTPPLRETSTAGEPTRTSTPRSTSDSCTSVDGELLLAAEQPRRRLDDRHLRAEREPRLAELDADHAAAEHDQPLRHLLRRSSPRGSSRRAPRRGRGSAASRPRCRSR